jgi:agmatinase
MKVLGIEHNFLALEEEFSSYENSPVVIQSLPYEHTSSYHKGSAGGPEALLKASHFVEFYDEELDQETVFDLGGIATMPILDFKGATDAAAMDLITEETRKLLADEKFVVSIGSEHSVTYGVIRAFVEKFGSDFSILQIDAHSDLREAYQGNPFSHASVMARCLETGVHLTQVGIRAQCIEESKVCRNNPKVTTLYAHQLDTEGDWMKTVLKSLRENVYITVDADGLDPSVMPSVGTAEPNGLSWQQTTRLLKKVCAKRRVLGFDVVEFIPREADTITEYNCAKLAYKMIGYSHKS